MENLLTAKYNYQSIDETKIEIIEQFDHFIAKQVKEEIEGISLEKTFNLMYIDKDGSVIDLFESSLEDKMSTTNLEDLLEEQFDYKRRGEPKDNILKLFNDSITQKFKTASLDNSFNTLLDQIRSNRGDILVEELIESLSKSDILAKIIDVLIYWFVGSTSYNSAGRNTRLIIKIAEYLSPTQWEKIVETFFQNNQLYDSFSCIGEIESLFQKSLELNNSVQPYWISFREKLNKFDAQHHKGLKELIDLHMN